ncbi:MAG: hypothetical protein ABIY51_01155 [Ferruginibacter sp.]
MNRYIKKSILIPLLIIIAPVIGISQSFKKTVLFSQIKKENIIQWLKEKKSPNTPVRNNMIKAILENALFEKMYAGQKNSSTKMIIVPLKKSYFSQHINKNEPLPFQNMILESDKNDNLGYANIMLVKPLNGSLKELPKNTFHNFFYQDEALDGTYTLISITGGDQKVAEMQIKDGQRAQYKGWRSKKVKDSTNTYQWELFTDIITKDSIIHLPTQNLGKSKTTSPPMFKGDLRSKLTDE